MELFSLTQMRSCTGGILPLTAAFLFLALDFLPYRSIHYWASWNETLLGTEHCLERNIVTEDEFIFTRRRPQECVPAATESLYMTSPKRPLMMMLPITQVHDQSQFDFLPSSRS